MAQPEIIKDIDSRVKIPGDTMTGNLTAPTFIGTLDGNASSADKLNIDAGGLRQPIYFNDGKPVIAADNYVFYNEVSGTVPSGNPNSFVLKIGDTMTGNLTAPTFIGSLRGNADTATKASQDSDGAVISSTYLKLSGGIMTGPITLASKGYQTNNAAGYYTNEYGNFIHSQADTKDYWHIDNNDQTISLKYYFETGNLSTQGTMTAPTFIGSLQGNADTATKAAQDGNGNIITSTYLPLSGGTVSGTVQLNGTTIFADRSKINKVDFSSIQTSAPPVLALALKNAGYALYNDEEFASGNNNCQVYNNNGNGTVTIERISDSTAANTSGYILKITSRGNATPGYGGFYQTTYARANAVYFQLFRAKIPVGYSVVTASNSMGSNYKDYWITNTAGTGRWEWYGRLTVCGYTGSFSSGGHVYITGSPTPSSSAPLVWYVASCNTYDLTKGAYINATKVYGAIWNDYAEYRSSDPIESGRVICETGNGTLKLSTERLQPGANVVSDTFGFAIGETENCKTPIAVSGRALVYTYEDRYSYEAGDPVCAAPGGTVSKMSREEVMMYPDRIVGTVSEIPEYERWGTGNVEVKNRIWIKVK